jgi:hypothetical protein
MAIENLHKHLLFEFEFHFWQKDSNNLKKQWKTHLLGLICKQNWVEEKPTLGSLRTFIPKQHF